MLKDKKMKQYIIYGYAHIQKTIKNSAKLIVAVISTLILTFLCPLCACYCFRCILHNTGLPQSTVVIFVAVL